ncbi:MAG: hypothetical protein R3C53_26185 [Pirellulaceae bacterium]
MGLFQNLFFEPSRAKRQEILEFVFENSNLPPSSRGDTRQGGSVVTIDRKCPFDDRGIIFHSHATADAAWNQLTEDAKRIVLPTIHSRAVLDMSTGEITLGLVDDAAEIVCKAVEHQTA